MNLLIAAGAFAGAAMFASCTNDEGGAQAGSASGSAGAAGVSAGGRGGAAGSAAAGGTAAGSGSLPGLVPFDPVWTKTTPPDWVPYPIPDTACDGCVYMNPDGIPRLVDGVRAQRADGRWGVFGDGNIDPGTPRAAWAIDIVGRLAYRVDDGCQTIPSAGSYCGGGIPSVDSGILAFGTSSASYQTVSIRKLSSGETKLVWNKPKTYDKQGQPSSASLLATGMAYPYAFWVEAGIYRLDLRDGAVVANGACDVIEAVTVARNGLACCDGYGQGAVVIDFDHDTIERYPAGFLDPNRKGIHSYLSKDGTELVWAEHPDGGRDTDSYRIVYRNLVSGEERVLVENDDPTVKRNDYPVVEGGVVFWAREMVAPAVPGFRTTGLWKVGDQKPTFWDRHIGQFRPTPYGLLGTGYPAGEAIIPAPNLLFPYPEGYRPATMPPPADAE